MFYYPNNGSSAGSGLALGAFFSNWLQVFLSPLLVFLDQLLGRRLISTFSGLCRSIIRLRSRSTGLYLSELGSYLLCPAQAPAGTKRISNLLRSPKWSESNLIEYYEPPTKEPIHVPGLRWVGLLRCGLRQQPQLARFRWWTSRGTHLINTQ